MFNFAFNIESIYSNLTLMKRPFVLLGALMLTCWVGPNYIQAAPDPLTVSQKSNTVTGKVVDENGDPGTSPTIPETGRFPVYSLPFGRDVPE